MSVFFRTSLFTLHPSPLLRPLAAALLAILVGVVLGLLVVVGSPLGALAVALGLAVAIAVAFSVQIGLIALVAVASLLPFAVIPVRVGVQLTAVDALLVAIIGGWLVRTLVGQSPLRVPWAGRLLLAYVGVAVAALVAGAMIAPLGGAAARAFLKYLAAMLVMLAVVNVVRTREQARWLVRALLLGGALAAAIGLVIHALPPLRIVELLSSLSVVGYPSGSSILRFRPGPNNTYTDVLRATGTSIDPNVLGGLLMLAAALMLAQLVAPRPVIPRLMLVPCLGLAAVAMIATDSRSSWLGLAAAGAFLATIRYRKLWLLAVPVALALLYLPVGQEMLDRLISGFTARDRAAALRLDEYRQAIRLISDHPILGVGFGAAPELGTFVGVSSIYLLVGEHTGLVGLTLFLATLATLLLASLRAVRADASPVDRGLVATLQAPFVAALTAGLLDHYFMNPQFPHMVALFWLYAGLLLVTSKFAATPSVPRA